MSFLWIYLALHLHVFLIEWSIYKCIDILLYIMIPITTCSYILHTWSAYVLHAVVVFYICLFYECIQLRSAMYFFIKDTHLYGKKSIIISCNSSPHVLIYCIHEVYMCSMQLVWFIYVFFMNIYSLLLSFDFNRIDTCKCINIFLYIMRPIITCSYILHIEVYMCSMLLLWFIYVFLMNIFGLLLSFDF